MKRFSLKNLSGRINIKKLFSKNSKLPAVLLLLGCFTVIAATADYSRLAISASGTNVTERRIVVIDAGHGGLDSGAVGINGELEKDINLAVALRLRDWLTLSGFEAVLTRDTDISIHDSGVTGVRNQKISDMENRLKIIKSCDNCIFLSIHQNRYTEPEYFGAQIFYNENNPDNRLLAQIMQDNFKVIQPENDRQIKLMDDTLFLFKDTKTPAVLIECGFLSNPDDAAALSSSDYQRRMAFMIYNGIVRYLQTVSGIKQG